MYMKEYFLVDLDLDLYVGLLPWISVPLHCTLLILQKSHYSGSLFLI